MRRSFPISFKKGNPVLRASLVQSLGPSYSATFADQVLEAALELLSRGELSKALGLVESAGSRSVQDELRQRFAEHVAHAIDEGRREWVRRVVEVPTAVSLLPRRDLIRALEFSSAKVPAVVRSVKSDRGYCFARLTGTKVRCLRPRLSYGEELGVFQRWERNCWYPSQITPTGSTSDMGDTL